MKKYRFSEAFEIITYRYGETQFNFLCLAVHYGLLQVLCAQILCIHKLNLIKEILVMRKHVDEYSMHLEKPPYTAAKTAFVVCKKNRNQHNSKPRFVSVSRLRRRECAFYFSALLVASVQFESQLLRIVKRGHLFSCTCSGMN